MPSSSFIIIRLMVCREIKSSKVADISRLTDLCVAA